MRMHYEPLGELGVRILRRPEVLRLTGLSASSIRRMERTGEFPMQVRLSLNAVGWREDEVVAWIEALGRGPRAGESREDQSTGAIDDTPASQE
jgi:prophage regulatory protein